MRQLKPQDAQFLYMEDGELASHITAICICDQSTAPNEIVRFKDIIDLIKSRLSASKIYKQKLMRVPLSVDHPYWVEDPYFDPEYHIHHSQLPEPRDWRQFCIHMARYHSRPIDISRPPWEIYIVEGLGKIDHFPDSAFAVVVKVHHAAVDGTSLQEFIGAMFDLSPEGPPLMPQNTLTERHPGGAVSTQEIVTRAVVNNALAPMRMTRTALELAPDIARATTQRLSAPNSTGPIRVPHTRFNGEISPHRAFDATSFKLDDFKSIKSRFRGATVNDVVLAITAGGVRKYLQSKNELPKDPLIINSPVNLRAQSKADQFAPKADGNNISTMTAPVYTNIQDPSERLKAIIRATKAAKNGKSGLQARLLMDLTKHVPAMSQSMLMRFLVNNRALTPNTGNYIVSNVASMPMPVYLCGAKVSDLFGMAPIGANLGLFIATPSYAGKISFCLTTTRDIIPDTPFFIKCLRDAFEELKAAAEERKTNRKTRPAERTGKPGDRFKLRTRAQNPKTGLVNKRAALSPNKAAESKITDIKAKSAASKGKNPPAKAKPAKKSETPNEAENSGDHSGNKPTLRTIN